MVAVTRLWPGWEEVATVARRGMTREQRADYHRQEWLCERHDAEEVRCPQCAAEPGVTCVNVVTGLPLAGPPAHPARIRLASIPSQRDPAA